MPTRVFIDGAAGTTGLEIRERLAGRSEFELIVLDDAQRKNKAARRDALVENGQGIGADDPAVDIRVAVAGARLARRDEAHDRTGIAAQLVARGGHRPVSSAASTRCGSAGTRCNSAPVAWRIAFRMAGAVGIRTCSPSPRAP